MNRSDDDPEDEYRERRARPGTEDDRMRLEEFRHPKAESGRIVQANGWPLYAKIVNAKGIALTALVGFDAPGELWISSRNERDDYRPIRLTVAEARALRDGLNLYLEDHAPSSPEEWP